MKRLITGLLLIFCWQTVIAQSTSFDFDAAWESVYRLELQGLPKSAAQKVDSIYTAASELQNAQNRVKAVIYQSKFLLLISEADASAVINNFEKEIEESEQPISNILENMLAKLYLNYYQQNTWKISRRSELEQPEEDFRLWDKKAFENKITTLFDTSLQLDSVLLNTPITAFEHIIDKEEAGQAYRPLLFDLLAHNALKGLEALKNSDYNDVPRYFNSDVLWSLSHDFVKLDLKPQTGDETISKMMVIYQKLSALHLNDSLPEARVYLEIERFKFFKANTNLDEPFLHYQKALDKLRQNNLLYDAVALIDFARAEALYQMSNNYPEDDTMQFKAVEAKKICHATIANFPDHFGARQCQSLLDNILGQDLTLSIENHIIPEQPTKMYVQYKNHEELLLRSYPLSYKSFHRFVDNRSDSAKNAFLEKLTPAHEWSAILTNEGDYLRHSTEITFQPHDMGSYMIVASSPKNPNRLSYQFVQVTQMAIIEMQSEPVRKYMVLDRENGKPLPGVRVVFNIPASGNKPDKKDYKTARTTNKKGIITLPGDAPNGSLDISLQFYGDTTTVRRNYIYNNGRSQNKDTDDYDIRLNFFSDRAIYRPGQPFYFKAILTKQWPDHAKIYPDQGFTVFLHDANNAPIDSLKVTTNEFGSVAGEFKLPKKGLTGRYHLEVDTDIDDDYYIEGAHGFSVEEYKRPKFELSFDPITELYTVNDSIHVSGTAKSLAGSNVTGARVTYKVSRRTSSTATSRRYSWEPTFISEGEVATDNRGNFKVPFIALPDGNLNRTDKPVFVYEVKVDITDINGETRSATSSVRVGYHKYEPSILTRELDKNTDSPTFNVQVNSLNGIPQDINGKLRITKTSVPELVKRPALWPVPEYPGFIKPQHDELFPHLPFQYSKQPKTAGDIRFDRIIEIRENQPISLEDISLWPPGNYEAEFTISSPTVAQNTTTSTFELKDLTANQVPDNKLFDIWLDKDLYRAGETAILRYGSASEDLHVTIQIEKGDKIVQSFTAELSKEVRTLEIPVLKSDQGGFGIFYHYTAYNHFNSGQVKAEVLQEVPTLQLEVGTFRDKLTPGSPEEWTFKIKGKNRRKITAEVLASMYDASLDQFEPNTWRFDPFNLSNYYAYSGIKSLNSFRTSQFDNRQYFYPSSIQSMAFSQFQWFGLSLSGGNANETYLRNLRWRHAPNPVVFSNKKDDLPKGTIAGRVLDEQGIPLKDVNVLVANGRATTTNAKGEFETEGKAGQLLRLSFVGYKTFTLKLNEDNYFDILMVPDEIDLQEVLVTAYGISHEKKELTYSISTITVSDDTNVEDIVFSSDFADLEGGEAGFLMSKAEGVPIAAERSFFSLESDKKPLIIVDGVFVSADSLDPANVASAQRLTGAATGIYGSQGANEVIIITTKQAQEAQDALLAQVKTRQNLQETAFFFPQIKTDRRGNFSFHFTSPESLTRWNLQLMAHDKRLASLISHKTVVTQKELMVLPNPPRFFREGDNITFSAKVASLSPKALNGFAKLELFDEVTGKALTGVIANESENKQFQLKPKENTSLSWKLSIPEGVQAIRYKIVAATDEFSDGEENVLPVLSNRLLVQESIPLWATPKSTQTFSLDKLKSQQSNTLTHHRLTLTMTTNPVWEAIQSLPYLMEYPYECAEQTFARYYANALGSYLVDEFPSIKATLDQWGKGESLTSKLEQNEELKSLLIEETPWLREAKSQQEQQKRLAMLFESARMREQLTATLNKLRDMQLNSGGFPWFSGSDRANPYMTRHIVAGLAHLQKLTLKTEFDDILQKGQAYLDRELIKRHKRIKEFQDVNINDQHITFAEVQDLYVRSLLPVEETSEELQIALNFMEKQAYTHWLQMGLQAQAMIAIYAKKNGKDSLALSITRSLKEYSISDEEKGVYWKSNTQGWCNWQAPIETQALLIEAFSEVDQDSGFINGMTQWLLSEKRTQSWKSTKATTEAIYALLNGNTSVLRPNEDVSVNINKQELISPKTGDKTMATGYFKKSWLPEEITSQMAEVTVNNGGNTIAFGGLHWQYFEDLDNITPSMGPLNLEKKLFRVTSNSGKEVLKAIDESSTLSIGDLVRVRIVLRSDRAMEFIHLKDMRAAGLEPVKVLSGYHWQDGLGYYESTRDAATNFFIEYLPKGNFVFEYDLRVNNAGDFSNGITSIQNMYAPEFSSHSEGIRVKIDK